MRNLLAVLLLSAVICGCTETVPTISHCYVRRVDSLEAFLTDGSSRHDKIPTSPCKLNVQGEHFSVALFTLERSDLSPRCVVQFNIVRVDESIIRITSPQLKVKTGWNKSIEKLVEDSIQQYQPTSVPKNQWTAFFSVGPQGRDYWWELWWGNREPDSGKAVEPTDAARRAPHAADP